MLAACIQSYLACATSSLTSGPHACMCLCEHTCSINQHKSNHVVIASEEYTNHIGNNTAAAAAAVAGRIAVANFERIVRNCMGHACSC